MSASLVGSEMCIRDSPDRTPGILSGLFDDLGVATDGLGLKGVGFVGLGARFRNELMDNRG
eukprot:7081048-Alexandrium_andersonii.AAC.1